MEKERNMWLLTGNWLKVCIQMINPWQDSFLLKSAVPCKRDLFTLFRNLTVFREYKPKRTRWGTGWKEEAEVDRWLTLGPMVIFPKMSHVLLPPVLAGLKDFFLEKINGSRRKMSSQWHLGSTVKMAIHCLCCSSCNEAYPATSVMIGKNTPYPSSLCSASANC